jgi:hypothetical protein
MTTKSKMFQPLWKNAHGRVHRVERAAPALLEPVVGLEPKRDRVDHDRRHDDGRERDRVYEPGGAVRPCRRVAGAHGVWQVCRRGRRSNDAWRSP